MTYLDAGAVVYWSTPQDHESGKLVEISARTLLGGRLYYCNCKAICESCRCLRLESEDEPPEPNVTQGE